MRGGYFDKSCQPISRDEWCRLLDNDAYRIVAQHDVPGGRWLSTVWLGLDHNFGGEGPPLIFETMLFRSRRRSDGLEDEEVRRTATEKEALATHLELLGRLGGRA